MKSFFEEVERLRAEKDAHYEAVRQARRNELTQIQTDYKSGKITDEQAYMHICSNGSSAKKLARHFNVAETHAQYHIKNLREKNLIWYDTDKQLYMPHKVKSAKMRPTEVLAQFKDDIANLGSCHKMKVFLKTKGYEINPSTIRWWCERNGIIFEKNDAREIFETNKESILKMLQDKTYVEVAAHFGLKRSTLCAFIGRDGAYKTK